ncbi:AMP-binding protein [Tomitella biformata]|uniref:AMP-binding protein n=1 Tax=Tomitella biformata TaxID=630403 RepID=UPI0004676024|nr:AMP-binding protein [Tomitella biformata]
MATGSTLGAMISDNASRFGDVPAYLLGQHGVTHAELRRRGSALAAALARAGLRRQDRVAVLSKNSVQFGEVLAAAHLSGLIAATVNFRLAPDEMIAILQDSEPRALFLQDEYLSLVPDLRARVPGIDLIVRLPPGSTAAPGGQVLDYEELVESAAGAGLPFQATADDIACLIYTSGTTGSPKGCVLGQRELRQVAATMSNEMRTGSRDRVLLTMPMFHIGAMAIAMGAHERGGTAVLRAQFDPADVLRAVQRERIDVLHLAPTMLHSLVGAASGSPAGLSSVRTVVYSAAPMPIATLKRALAVMPDAGFLNLYGQTEVITSGLPREFHDLAEPANERRLSTVGFPFPGTEVRIVDEQGRPLPAGGQGEIAVRSASMFRGYWNRSAATVDTIRDGWCHTGDIGLVDDEGLLRLLDRKKDLIITGGENVASLEVEEAVSAHPAVAECAVIGVPDEKWGEAVCATVVLVPNATLTLAAIGRHLETRLARFKTPRRLVIVEELPKLPTGKIDKKLLREWQSRPEERRTP